MIFKDYYKILGLGSNKVSIEQIKTAYRELAKKYHPDRNIGNRIAEEKFKDIGEAYKILSDVNNKRKYDKMWNAHIGNKINNKRKEEEGNNDLFSIFFGNIKKEEKGETVTKNKKVAVKGDNIETEVNISIKEGFLGENKKISLRAVDGNMKTFTIKIPAGIRNGEKIRLIGQGKKGQYGGKNGDLFIRVNIEDSKEYHLNGLELITNAYITPSEAALGTKIILKGIEEEINLRIPAGTGSGEQIEIPQKGYKDGKGGRGNLIVEIRIVVPKKLTEKEKSLYEELKKVSKFNPRHQTDQHNTRKVIDNAFISLYN